MNITKQALLADLEFFRREAENMALAIENTGDDSTRVAIQKYRELYHRRIPWRNPSDSLVHHDNVRVQRRRYGGEFLAVTFQEPSAVFPFTVSLVRYCVPGRCDSYSFDYVPGACGIGPRVSYFTDYGNSLPASLQAIQEDLDRNEVVAMLVEACEKKPRFAVELTEHLVAALAPKSRALRTLRKAIKLAREARKRRLTEQPKTAA